LKVLGISPDVWISSAALVEDGQVISAAAEERFDRQKMSNRFPRQAMNYCLREAGYILSDIDCLVVPWNPGHHIRAASGRYIDAMRWRGEYLVNVPGAVLNVLGSPPVSGISQEIQLEGSSVNIHYVDHHMAHAAGGYFQSPFDEAVILTVDGRGETETCTFMKADGQTLTKLRSITMPHSLGLLYGTITEFLGFKAHSDEWKVMALASMGKSDTVFTDLLRSLITLRDDGGFEQDLRYFDYYQFDRQPYLYSEKLIELLGPSRGRDDPIEDRHADIAQALQQVFEEVFTHMLEHLFKMTGCTNLVLAGGAVMNSVYNGKIHDLTPFKEVFISSCPDDSGVSVGAALYIDHCRGDGSAVRSRQLHNFWGPAFSNEDIADALAKCGLKAEYHEDIEDVTSKLIADRLLIGWFQERMEFGQRALGNRSILADPRGADTKDKINAAVKYRESFRPFAPAILEERVADYFYLPPNTEVRFMERVFPIREEKREEIPAVVHFDGTGRLQTVTADASPRFHKLISAFEKATGVPVLLNTSFNVNGEPIVCTPSDAIRTFYSCGLDVLVMGNYLLRK
jgi:carbamoyltransferase